MIPRPLDDIESADLLRLVNENEGEGQKLEFKAYRGELPHRDNVVNPVCAFANTAGGDLVLGIDAPNGFASEITPIPQTNIDSEKQRIEAWLTTGIEPSGINWRLRHIAVDGGYAIVIRVLRSWAGPHRNHHTRQFQARNSSGNYELPMEDLRRAYTSGAALVERVRAFHAERALGLQQGQSLVAGLSAAPKIMLHLVPMSFLALGGQLDVLAVYQALANVTAFGRPITSRSYNLDGVLAFSHVTESICEGYIQVFRDGRIEAVCELDFRADLVAPADPMVIPHLLQYLQLLHTCQVEPPIFALISLVGAAGKQIERGQRYFSVRNRPSIADRDVITLPDVELPSVAPESLRALKPAFDVLWNAFGIPRSPFFDDKGDYNPPNR